MIESSIINQLEEPQIEYPIMLQHNHIGYVVLFWDERKGTVIHAPKDCPFPVGFYSETWRMDKFKIQITYDVLLSNK